MRPEAAAAVDVPVLLGAENDGGDLQTTLHSTNAFHSLKVFGSGAYAISGEGEGSETTGVIGIGSGPSNGVRGVADQGVGLLGESEHGHGLKVDGRAGFSTAGAATVQKGRASVTVHSANVVAASLVIATIQRDRAETYVRGVLVSKGSFRILLNRRVGANTKVAYFVVETVAPFPD